MLSLQVVFEALDQCQISAAGLIVTLLTSREYENHPFVTDLLARSGEILGAFSQHPASQYQFVPHLFSVAENAYLQELHHLTSEDGGWHFKASCTSTKQLEDFDLREMAQKMEVSAPKWWGLLGAFWVIGERES
ncbi:hypothetical protein EDD15DRAFT_2168140 [Pisolithus albus]|nr:hypothetical protein EDD15DRAFT_2168140 [Pisolithus albus]